MSTTNRFDARNHDIALVPRQTAISTGTKIRHINDDQSLFRWMWEQLDISEPKVAVDGRAPGCLDELFQTLAFGRSTTYPPLEWPVIFSEVRWHDLDAQNARRCSIALLAFLGHLSAFARYNAKWSISTSEACEMMLDCSFRSGNYLGFRDWSETSRFIVNTPLCERLHRVKINVRVDGPALEEDWWLDCN